MSEYYTKTGNPQANSSGSSSLIRAEFTAIESGLAKLPTMAGNGGSLVAVAAGATSLTTFAGGAATDVLVGGGAGALPVWTTATGSGAPVRSTSPTLVTPALGTPASGVMTNVTGLPMTTGVTGILAGTNGGTGVNNSTRTLTYAGNVTFTGAFAVSFAVPGAYTYTLPSATGTLADLASAQTLSNKTLTAPILGTPVSGNLSSCTADGTNSVGFLHIPQNSQSTAYTCVLADAGKHILHPAADTTARIYTIPANSSVAYPVGAAITFINQNAAGVITISITTDTLRLAGAGTTGSRTLAANGIATAIKITSTEWIISGSGLT